MSSAELLVRRSHSATSAASPRRRAHVLRRTSSSGGSISRASVASSLRVLEEMVERLSLQSATPDLAALGECHICYDAPRTIRFRPCRHTVACERCVLRLIATASGRLTCPHCKQRVDEVVSLTASAEAGAATCVPLARQRTYTPAEADLAEGRTLAALLAASPYEAEAAAAAAAMQGNASPHTDASGGASPGARFSSDAETDNSDEEHGVIDGGHYERPRRRSAEAINRGERWYRRLRGRMMMSGMMPSALRTAARGIDFGGDGDEPGRREWLDPTRERPHLRIS